MLAAPSCDLVVFKALHPPLFSHLYFFRMFPIVEKEKSLFVKCNYNERERLFEGNLPKDVSSSGEREVSIASLCFQPKLLCEKKPIEIGLSFGEGGNTLIRIDKGRGTIDKKAQLNIFQSFRTVFKHYWGMEHNSSPPQNSTTDSAR